MKNKFLTILSIGLFALLLSCNKSGDPAPSSSFKKEDFNGTWQEDGSEASGCTQLIKIDATYFIHGIKCGTTLTFGNGLAYTFANNSIAYSEGGSTWKLEITTRTSTTFKAKLYGEGFLLSEPSYTKL